MKDSNENDNSGMLIGFVVGVLVFVVSQML